MLGRKRSLSNTINCPETHECMKLHGESGSVCCPMENETVPTPEGRQQSSKYSTISELLRGLT